MSNLKNVRAELEKMKKEMAAKEAELKREEVRPVIELINNELLNSEDVQEKMSAYSKDEARVIAKHIVKNIDAIISESQGEINELRAKKKERAEKRKAAKLDRELEKMAAEDDYERSEPVRGRRPIRNRTAAVMHVNSCESCLLFCSFWG